jgi:AcrR family transcriptional regulator
MRVTAQTKVATRRAILETARRLFTEAGFDQTTTRDIAQAAGIATGTLFNYFATKEAVLACLAADAASEAAAETRAECGSAESLEEDLFALIAAGLRRLKPLRKHLPALLDSALSPAALPASDDAAAFRVGQLEALVTLAAKHGFGSISPIALQLYWTLYTGALAFWAGDKSPKQEDTLALIDDSLEMFVAWLKTPSPEQDRRGR